MAARWSSEFIAAEHRDLQVSIFQTMRFQVVKHLLSYCGAEF